MSMKYTKDRQMDQVSISFTNIFHCKTLQNLPKFGFLVWKQTIWQPRLMCVGGGKSRNHIFWNRSRVFFKSVSSILSALDYETAHYRQTLNGRYQNIFTKVGPVL
jgi:hypothetical protein